MTAASRWARVCAWLALVKVAAGLGVFAAGLLSGTSAAAPIPYWVHFLNTAVFGATGAWLVFGGRSDPRAIHLGAAFLVTGSSFADPLTLALSKAAPFNPLAVVHADAFLAYLYWLFCRDFPRGFTGRGADRVVRWALRLSLGIGSLLLAANVFLNLPLSGPTASAVAAALEPLSRRSRTGYYWIALFALTVPAPLFALWKARRAPLEERRRVRLFLAGLTLGAPLMLDVVLEAVWPAFRARARSPAARTMVGIIFYPLLLSIAVTTAYSVTVHRVLEVRLIVQKALQYFVARYAVVAITAIPFAAIALYLYRHRNETIAALLSGYRFAPLLAAAVVALVAYRLRDHLVDGLDRRFFREEYDSRLILASLAGKARSSPGPEELAALLHLEIDRALHLESIAAVFHDPATHSFRSPDGRVRPLDASSALAVLAGEDAEPMRVDLEDPASSLRRLPLDDRQWLADGGFRLLVPLFASTGQAVGLIALGDKRSELPFSRGDCLLLKAIASSVALAIESRLYRASLRPPPAGRAGAQGAPPGDHAGECAECGRLQPAGAPTCGSCGHDIRPAPVPYVLLGKFRLESRIGAGAMGVVYAGIDLALGRRVAIKTLPRVSPEYAMRLRREARAMAAVAHPNLAVIYGAETWAGVPMLIFEYLDGGTLADKLKRGPVPLDETLQLGITLAGVLERTHAAGILHRDIKPSNIGYTTGGAPKLLDFGLSHLLDDSRLHEGMTDHGSRTSGLHATDPATTLSFELASLDGSIAGTPLYLSPEAVKGRPPAPSFDLWSLSIVLYEVFAGANPVHRGSLVKTLECISTEPIPDLRSFVPDCPPEAAHFFRDALAREPEYRPSTATELRRRLERLVTTLGR